MSRRPFHHDAMYGISRVPRGSWEVELKREGVVRSKTFSFRFHGGEEKALLRAQAWRDEIVRKYPPMTRRARAEILMSTSSTGIPGVQCALGPGGQPQSWTARTRIEPGKTLSKYFSVRRYGAEQAKALAIAERQKQLKQMKGHVKVHPSEAVVRAAPKRSLPFDGPVPLTLRSIVRRNNTSGIPGVFFQSHPENPGRWVAATSNGKNTYLRKSFAVGKYGEEQAKVLAIAERERQLRRVNKHGSGPKK